MQIYYLPLTSALWTRNDSQLLTCVSQERMDKVLCYKNIPDRRLSLYAALVARMGLSLMTGIPAGKLLFYNEPNHKPELLSVHSFNFSISHTRDVILCCVSSDGSVGVDVERLKAAPFEIMKQIFHPDEIHYIKSAPFQQQDFPFFEIWTRKEAYTKQLGIGLVHDPSSYNTLSPSLSFYLNTLQQDSYIYSVSCKNPESFTMNQLTERDIHSFFL